MKSVAREEALLSDDEIEAILAEENALMPESHEAVSQQHLAETTSGVAPWVKWLLFFALGSEFLLGMTKLLKP